MARMAMPTVQKYMTSMPHTVPADATAEQALAMMRRFGIRHLPVRAGEKLVGVVSERGLRAAEAAGDPAKLPVSRLMTRDPYVVPGKESLADVAAAMARNKYGSAIVTDAKGKVVGIFTSVDAARVLAAVLRQCASGTAAVSDLVKLLHGGPTPRWFE